MIRELLLEASHSDLVRERLARSHLAQRASHRFMPGEELDDAIGAVRELWHDRVPCLLTRLGEAVTDPGQAAGATSHYLAALDRLESERLPGDVSVKPTQLGLGLGVQTCLDNLGPIVERAAGGGRVVWIDMEDSSTTAATLDIFEQVAGSHANLGLALQANLRRTKADLERLIPLRPRIRLVKGAYSEPGPAAFHGRREVNAAYLELAGDLLSWAAAGRAEPVFGTHDAEMVAEIANLAAVLGASPHAYEVHMLYGIRSEDLYRLAREGTHVRVLISYGPDWAAWYLRRLAERPANVALAVTSLLHRPR